MDDDDLRQLVFKYALVNATGHSGQARNGAVMGMIMAQHPELRSQAKRIGPLTSQVVAQVNQMSQMSQEEKLEELGGHQAPEKKGEGEKELPPLPGAEDGVVLRFAPNPSGPLHIGHARAAILNQAYQERYGGKLILRVEDTDPRRVYPPAYKMIQEDLAWLGVEWQEEVVQSQRLEIYYEVAEEAILAGAAYMCTCPGDEFKKLKDSGVACPHRGMSPQENLNLWEKMPEYGEGGAVLRIKTDLEHKNPAIRDWVAMRIVDHPHPLLKDKYRVYPMMNFSVAVDDHLLGVSHVLRGKDHLANTEKQGYLYRHLDWEEPHYTHYGRLKMEDMALSTSKAKKGIDEGEYTGWDDPRLGTLRAVRRRGIQAQSIRELMMEIGVKSADTTVSWKKIYGLNRSHLEEVNRYFLATPARQVKILGLPREAKGPVERPLHPDHPERGMRTLNFEDRIYLSSTDIPKKPGQVVRLMDAVNITFQEGEARYHSTSLEEAREHGASIVQWVPMREKKLVEMVMPDGSVQTGYAEADTYQQEEGDVVQFERVGFACLDEKYLGKMTFYYAHK
ncbi:MAG: glutamate--tRNA ligase [Euryarchaeota archaeon]|jgi:glutamyl-tRNA synthetase|nr:glutamate--tRNA ligase [Euryarchaeota archaeon]